MNYPMKLMISGKSIAELATNARKFLVEVEGTASTGERQDSAQMVFPNVDKPVDKVEIPAAFSQPPNMAALDQMLNPPLMQTFPGAVNTMGVSADRDSKGIPWDDRIHASSKAKTKDGSWRYKRGVEDDVIAQIEAQLKNQPSYVAAPVVPPVPGAAIAPPTLSVVQPSQPAPAPVVASPAYQTPPIAAPTVLAQAPVQQPVAPPAPMPAQQAVSLVHSFDTFKKNLIPTLGELVRQGKLTAEYLGVLKNHFQVDELWKVNDEQLNQIFDNFTTTGLLQRAQ